MKSAQNAVRLRRYERNSSPCPWSACMARLEGDPRHRALGGHLDLEELARAERERAGDQERRELLRPRVVALDVRVEDAPRGLDLVLDAAQLRLQALEVVRGAQLRIRLGQGVDRAERAGEPGLRPLHGARLAGLDGRRAGRGDALERLALVRRIAPDGLHEVGHEVVTPLQLDV